MKKNNYNLIIVSVLFFILGYFANTLIIKTGIRVSNTSGDFSLFWKVWETLEKKYPFEEPEDSEKIYDAIRGLVSAYGDDYSVFFPPESAKLFQDTVTGSFGGAGMEIAIREGYLYVVAPLKNSPAEKAGVRAGDIIVKIDGKTITGKTMNDLLELIRGEVGTKVSLSVLRFDNSDEIELSITRDIVNIPIMETSTVDDFFVISLYNFNKNSEIEFKNALKKFKETELHKLVIDLRNNPGGFLTSSIDISSYFIDRGKIIVIEDFGDSGKEQKIHRSKGFDFLSDINYDMYIVINKGSASASEIFAGALQDYKKAIIIGEQSYGKGSVQELINLDGNTSLKITTARWLTPNKRQISKKGVSPDYIIENIDSLSLDNILKNYK